ncbi:MAG: hotdog domain-containing protein [bacterium]|nr:hotdog domain-containing protein [bacterium]
MDDLRAVLRFRVGQADAHYAGNLVAGGRILEWFGDAATELCALHDGDEGLFVAYDLVEFRAPVYAGDFLEVRARLTRVGKTSRAMTFEAHKYIRSLAHEGGASAADTVDPPVLVARASGTCVVPAHLQRRRNQDLG